MPQTNNATTSYDPPLEPPVGERDGHDGGVSLPKLLHALRRQWVMILLLGVPLAAITALVLWWVLPHRYQAVAELLVRSQEDRLLPALDPRSRGRYVSEDYDIFRQTQASLITSTFVLNSVLRDPEIRGLSMVSPQETSNPIGFLQENIDASYPNDAEVLRISMRGENPAELKRIIDAVTDAYLEETVFNRRKELQQRINDLQARYDFHRDEIRKQRESIHTREIQLGATNSARPHIRHQLELEKLRNLDQARAELAERLHEIDLQVALSQAMEENSQGAELPEYLVAEELERDDEYRQLQDDYDQARQVYVSVASAARNTSPSVQRAAAQTELISGQLAARRRQLGRRLEQKLLDTEADGRVSESSQAVLAAEQEILRERHDEVASEYEDQLAFVQQLDGYSARLESDREELASAVKMNQARSSEIADLEIQLDSPQRITKIQGAMIPNANSLQTKLMQVIGSAFVVLGLVAAGFVGWDIATGRVDNAREAMAAAGAAVFGKLPRLQSRALWRQVPSTEMETVLAESADGIRTALLRKADREQRCMTILLTSAVGGEGKTTLASHLAVSFARTGHRVLLVDADTTNPQHFLVFGAEDSAGFCDGLRAGENMGAYAIATGYERLDLLPTGRRDSASQTALANDCLDACLEELREAYDFIVVDTSPVLTNADPLIIGKHADAIVLSVMRDVSRLSAISDARDRLSAANLELTGIVVHGDSVALRRKRGGNSDTSGSNNDAPAAEHSA